MMAQKFGWKFSLTGKGTKSDIFWRSQELLR